MGSSSLFYLSMSYLYGMYAVDAVFTVLGCHFNMTIAFR